MSWTLRALAMTGCWLLWVGAALGQVWGDVTEIAGIDFRHLRGSSSEKYLPETMGAGLAVLDYDGDGWMDLYLVQSGDVSAESAAVNRLLRNRGDGSFEDVTEQAGVGDSGYGQGAVAADFDDDSDTDLYVSNFGPNVLLRNNADGTFTDVTSRAGVGDPAWSTSASFFDADEDGDLDLYVVNYLDFSLATHVDCRERREGVVFYCHPDTYPMAPDTFYRNRGDGLFEIATAESGLIDTSGKGLGVVAADFDGDGRADLYVANDSTPNFLYRNRGGGRFEDVGLFAGVAYNEEGRTEAGMGVDAGDVNGDGLLDLFVTNLSLETNALYLGGASEFTYATRPAGLHGPSLMVLGFGTDLLDVDNDGDLDIFVANGDVNDKIELFNDALAWRQPAQVLLNDGQGVFVEMSASMLGDLAIPRVGRGAVGLDYDNDGLLDLVLSYNDDRARLFRNRHPETGWLKLAGERPGTKARLRVMGQTQMDEVKTGSSYASSGDPRLHFGLGGSAAESLEVLRSDGSRRRLLKPRGSAVYRFPDPSSKAAVRR